MTTISRTTGALLVAIPLVFTAGFTGLQMTFDYPDILRHPAGEVLTRFAAAGVDLHLYWYAMMVAGLAMIPAAIGLGLLLWERDRFLAALSIGAGVLAGLVQALGLLRWVLLVPGLAATYVAPDASDATREMCHRPVRRRQPLSRHGRRRALRLPVHRRLTVFVALLIVREHKIIAGLGLVLALGVVTGMVEPFGVELAGTINALSYTLWAVWLLVLGIIVLRGDARGTPDARHRFDWRRIYRVLEGGGGSRPSFAFVACPDR